MQLTDKQIQGFRRKILSFYKKSRRNLPWRNTTDQYHILISEFMLQQTQVRRVIIHFERWIKTWPTIYHLAAAKKEAVLREWMGLGYNNRALYLHETAKRIVSSYGGDVLRAMQSYQDLPGIGPYTAHAVLIFASNADIAAVDTNIRRIIIHEFHLKKCSPAKLQELAQICLPKGRSRDWHNALMDYGSLVMTSRRSGIPALTKQGKFEGSDRQWRAKILRRLLNQSLEQQELYLSTKTPCLSGMKRFRGIVNKMIKEEILETKKGRVILRASS